MEKNDDLLDEFLVFKPKNTSALDSSLTISKSTTAALLCSDSASSITWTKSNTLVLLDVYQKYRTKVGTLEIRNFKRMWEIISSELKTRGVMVLENNCENRWRVLERNYKKYVDNKKKTGRGRSFFEYADEMEQILGKKKNINPTVVLSTQTVSDISSRHQCLPSVTHSKAMSEPVPGCSKDTDEGLDQVITTFEPESGGSSTNIRNENSSENPNRLPQKRKLEQLKKSTARKPRYKNNDILEKISVLKENRHKEKMKFEREKFNKLYELELRKQDSREMKLNVLKESNELQKKTNSLLELILQKKTDLL
ncbi:unnamed protein product [Psylliodes chrysocephalus]|uniref:Myb/SANT-like DNA-binding domain-containing protein n=1 Tax=Psylliodes chrysocephalus TaxID=3402493 RepID=A0A9P0G7K4_9CUCU|nr:unnamed protein product [Psylliodes chrysocephala]